MNQGHHGPEVVGNELYPTPPQLTKALLECGEPLPYKIWEPACGKGDMANVLRKAGHDVYCSDLVDYGWPGLHELSDFFDIIAARADCIVTNPPFSISEDFVRHGLTLCDKVIILNRLAFIEAKSRTDIIDGHLTKVYPFVNRAPQMHRWEFKDGAWIEWPGKKAPSAMPVAWFIFERDKPKHQPITLERISWRRT